MKARELAEILLQDPDQEVHVGYTIYVRYSELTDGDEDVTSDIEKITKDKHGFVLAADAYFSGYPIWPPLETK